MSWDEGLLPLGQLSGLELVICVYMYRNSTGVCMVVTPHGEIVGGHHFESGDGIECFAAIYPTVFVIGVWDCQACTGLA